MNFQRIGRRIQHDLKRIVKNGDLNTGNVVMFWDAESGGGAYDPNVEGDYPEAEPASGTYPALIHFVQPVTSGVRTFAEVEAGDVICDFIEDVELDGKKNPRFEIQSQPGVIYHQKNAGDELAQYWDLVVGGERMMRTVLLTRQGRG